MTQPVDQLVAYIPVSDADIVDYGIGGPEAVAAAQARLDRDRLLMERWWRSLPWWVRAYRNLRWRLPW